MATRHLAPALVVAAVLGASSCATGGPAGAGSGPTTASGTLTVRPGNAGSACRPVGTPGLVAPGTAVTVYDTAGAVLGTGALQPGRWVDSTCVLPFTVALSSSRREYTVSVGDNPKKSRVLDVRHITLFVA